ncbi:hypothetical protein AB0N20_08650 [Streptomyces griseoincarnatus]
MTFEYGAELWQEGATAAHARQRAHPAAPASAPAANVPEFADEVSDTG